MDLVIRTDYYVTTYVNLNQVEDQLKTELKCEIRIRLKLNGIKLISASVQIDRKEVLIVSKYDFRT